MGDERAAFDRTRAEADLHEVMLSLGIGNWSVPSDVEGVAVYACDDLADTDAIREGLEGRGHALEQVTTAHWIVDGEDGSLEEEVIVVAFDVPDLPDEWRLDARPSPGTP